MIDSRVKRWFYFARVLMSEGVMISIACVRILSASDHARNSSPIKCRLSQFLRGWERPPWMLFARSHDERPPSGARYCATIGKHYDLAAAALPAVVTTALAMATAVAVAPEQLGVEQGPGRLDGQLDDWRLVDDGKVGAAATARHANDRTDLVQISPEIDQAAPRPLRCR